jgi:hypothetical protein
MASLVESNPHLSDPVKRRKMLARNAIDSCAFEGARGLKAPSVNQSSDDDASAELKKSRNGAKSSK